MCDSSTSGKEFEQVRPPLSRTPKLEHVSREIHGYKRVEEKIKQYQSMVESAYDAIFFKDLKSRYIIANKKTSEAFGLSRDQVIGKNDYEIMANKEQARKNIEDDKLVFKTGKPREITKHMTSADGKERWFQAIKVPQFDDKGNITGLVGIARDITERKQVEEVLRKSREDYVAVANLTGDIIVRVDKEGRWTFLNDGACEFWGRPREKLLGIEFADYLYPDDAEKTNAAIEEITKTKQMVRGLVNRQKTPKGWRIVEWNAIPIFDKAGNYAGFQTTGRDISERRQVEKALVKEHNLLSSLIEALPHPIYVRDTNCAFVFSNLECARDLKLKSSEELVGKTDSDFMPREFAEQYYAQEQEILRTGQPLVNYEDCARDESGRLIRSLLITKVPWRDDTGNIIGTIGLNRDITDHKQIEEALAKEHNLLRALVDTLPDEIYVKDSNSTFVFTNLACVRAMSAETPEAMVGKTDSDFLPREYAEKFHAEEQEIMRTGRPIINQELPGYDESGRIIRWLSVTKVPWRDESGNIIGVIGLNSDITDRKLAEKKLLDYQAQLKSLASELSLTEERERHRIATELHDRISQSLVISKIKLEELLASMASSELTAVLDEIRNLLGQTIQDTRSLTFDLSYPILYELGFEAAVAEWLTEQVQEKHNIATEFEDDGKSKVLNNDIRVLLFRMVQELLINVVKHSQADKVKVSIRKVNSQVHVSIEDNGVGFNLAEVTSMLARTGGFGLFSIRERLEHLGGHLEIESEPGHGCRVTITAPLNRGKPADGE